MILHRLRLPAKLALLLGLSTLAAVAIAAMGAMTLHERMQEDRLDKYRATVGSTVTLAAALDARVSAKEITREQAVEAFHRDIRAIRFDNGTGYMSVVDIRTGNVLMHGVNPALEGKPTPVDRATGKSISDLVNNAIRSSDEGTTSYMFPKPGQTEPLRKIVMVARFSPWDIAVYSGAYTDDLDALFHDALLRMGAVGGGIVLLTSFVAWLVSRDITGSLGRLKATMTRLAANDLTVVVTGTERRDEVGEMASAVLVFQQHLVQEQQNAAERAAERQRATAEKASALTHMANTIEAETASAMVAINGRVAVMNDAARTMQGSAARTGASAESAATSACQTLATTQTVASAAEELSVSIREISQQVNQSTSVVRRAVTAGDDTRAAIEVLTEKVERIGTVADMITAIASKTNLLALNATIEAARAGDAGRGFAVVASEVKGLALQTANATGEIAQQIHEIRTATGASVAAVRSIEQTIREVESITGSIAAAVEEQGAATAEIARNVAEAAEAANAMSARASEVSVEASQTDHSAGELQENAAGLAVSMTELRQAVIRAVRTSTSEVNRRADERYELPLQGRLTMPGQASQQVRIADISIGGVRLMPGPSLTPGAGVSLSLDIVGKALPGTVLDSDKAGSRLRFNLDDATSGALRQALERVTANKAA